MYRLYAMPACNSTTTPLPSQHPLHPSRAHLSTHNRGRHLCPRSRIPNALPILSHKPSTPLQRPHLPLRQRPKRQWCVFPSSHPLIFFVQLITHLPPLTAPIQIGKLDEILGPITSVYFSVSMLDSAGVQATSFKPGDKVYISAEKVLPLERFLPKPKVVGGGT